MTTKKEAYRMARQHVGQVQRDSYGPHYFFRLKDPRDAQPCWVNMVSDGNVQSYQMALDARREWLTDIAEWFRNDHHLHRHDERASFWADPAHCPICNAR